MSARTCLSAGVHETLSKDARCVAILTIVKNTGKRGQSDDRMGIDGVWYNELGSQLTLKVNGNNISGTYKTTVGNAKGTYQVCGMRVPGSGKSDEAIGFVVAWVNDSGSSSSVTSWSGQWQIIDGKEEINTTWLLTSAEPPEDDWKSTLVGRDIFTRNKPSPKQVKARARRSPMSEPKVLT
jgi:Avidin family